MQDPAWVALELDHRIAIGATGLPIVLASTPLALPISAYLDDTVTDHVVETEGDLYDDTHQPEADLNYWNFCTAGAATTALYYWKPNNVTNWPAGNFTEPYGPHKTTTYWRSSDTGTASDTSNGYPTKGRAYEMYLAEQVKPPSYATPGIVNFTYYVTHGETLSDTRDALNWEASGHCSTCWSTYFYVVDKPASQAALHSDIASDIGGSGRAVVAFVDTGYLPNWSRSVSGWHAITIIGYDDSSGTYFYTDTCGHRCNTSSRSTNGGTWAIGQQVLFNAVHSLIIAQSDSGIA